MGCHELFAENAAAQIATSLARPSTPVEAAPQIAMF
jgi:hypothetical protein